MLLEVKKVYVHYGKAMALADVSTKIEEGKICSFIGANGAGKSTLLRTISGVKTITSGEIWFNQKRIDHQSPQHIVQLGIAHVPEGRQIFPFMTTLENLETGAYTRKDKKEIKKDLEKVYNYFPILRERQSQKAGSLSGGEQQMLAIGRSLMSNPRLLCLDEPSHGLGPLIVEVLAGIIQEINKAGISIILVEQNAALALELAHYTYVLETGRVISGGTPDELKENKLVREAYLGLQTG